jgi:pyruvate,water dikinase
MSSTSFSTLEGLAGRWLGNKELAHTLLTGLTGIIAAEMVPALWQMAQQLRVLGLQDVVQGRPAEAALDDLRAHPAARPFLAQFDAFLARHGHRCMTEAEWRYPRWAEAPDQVLEAVAGYLQSDGHFDPLENESRQQASRLEVMATVEGRLNPFQRGYFRRVVGRAERLVRMRDNGQHFLVKLALPMRRMFALIAERWAARGWLAQPDDFWFLLAGEIEAVLAAGDPTAAGLDLRGLAAERRRAYDYWFGKPFPELLDSSGRPMAHPALAAGTGDSLGGVPASAGRATGVARVILTPREASAVQPGEILVTRATDPGWTPLFSVIGAIVLEVGGQLSHGAIVAREYGLPAVVNVPEATRRIRDGQTITVDGTIGKIFLLEENGEGDPPPISPLSTEEA